MRFKEGDCVVCSYKGYCIFQKIIQIDKPIRMDDKMCSSYKFLDLKQHRIRTEYIYKLKDCRSLTDEEKIELL